MGHKGKCSLATNLLLLGLAICFLFLLDPENYDWGGATVREIKFAPVAAMLLSVILLLLSVRARWSTQFVLMFLFVSMMLLGALYSMLVLNSDLEETYLSRGLIACTSLLAGFLVAQRAAFIQYLMPKIVFMMFVYAWGVAVLCVLYRLDMAFGDLTQVYQVQSALVAAAILLTINRTVRPFLNKLSLVVFTITLLLIAKTTALLMLAIALAVFTYFYFTLHFSRLMGSHGTKMFSLFGLLVVIVSASVFLYQDRLDDRGNDTREANMEIRINQFMDSPIVGDLFTGSPLVDFGPLHIPSHSEWLDMLAAAGFLAIVFFFFPIAWLVRKSSIFDVSSKGLRLSQWLAFVIVMHSISMTVNPILFSPSLSIPFWLALGMLAGLHVTDTEYLLDRGKLFPCGKGAYK